MKLTYDQATEDFRHGLVAWLEANQPDSKTMAADPVLSSAHAPSWAAKWQRLLFDSGWLVPGWPPELGGRNAGPVEQMVYFEEFARLGVLRTTNPQGLSIIAPSILDYGSPAQKEAFALPLLRGETTACLGMSEPGAGSDLASLSTRATAVDGSFVVSGQKVWTSGAQHADFCFCFCRTDAEAGKHQGISVLIVPMNSRGIAIRPLPHLVSAAHADFNEVFFDEVVVPGENLVGELNHGWALAGASLAHERAMMWVSSTTLLDAAMETLLRKAAQFLEGSQRRTDNVEIRDQLAQLYIDTQAARFLGYRAFSKFARGHASPEQSVLKMFSSETSRKLSLVGTEMMGQDALDVSIPCGAPGAQPAGTPYTLSWAQRYLASFGNTIAGGTSEIQRNIVAERVLGLPRR